MLRESTDHGDDLTLVHSVLAKDAGAIDEFLRRMRCVPVILRSRNRRMGGALDRANLEDQVQEILAAVWVKLPTFSGRSSLEAWVYRFCVNKHFVAVRNQGRRRGVVAVRGDGFDEIPAPANDGSKDPELVQIALAELPEDCERVVRMKHFEGLTFEDIGNRLAIPANTAKTQYYRGLRQLRAFLNRRDGR